MLLWLGRSMLNRMYVAAMHWRLDRGRECFLLIWLCYGQFNRYVNVSALKHYFNVSNAYVLQKLLIVLFPWRHRPWSRQQTHDNNNGRSSPAQGVTDMS